MADAILTAERLRELLHYDPETGVFTWQKKRNCRVKLGGVAGSIYNNGYRVIGVDRKYRLAHRLAWLYVHGEMPAGEIDHINGDRTDNRIANLRDVSKSVNNQNKKHAMSNNTSGLLGACWDSYNHQWKAQIGLNGKQYKIGVFDSAESAHAAYLAAKRKLHEGCTI